MIELKKVNKIYEDGFHALKDIDLAFEEGKINVLIGPSGCGKTTTMKLLNRLVDYTDGQIMIDGKQINEFNPIELRRKMGFVIQNIGLFPHMTIYKNVATVPSLLKWDKEKIRSRVIELLEMVDLDPEIYMDRYPSELSGGQQQRIGVIRALAAEPSTILMDEPFSALDPISREQLQDELIQLQADISKTIIFVTHDMDEAIKIADQIILMKDGKVVQQGTPEEILTNPANDFVKEFIGEERLEEYQNLTPLQVSDYVHTDYLSFAEDKSVASAIEDMMANKISEIPVVTDEGDYIGLVSLYDALSAKDQKVIDIVDRSVATLVTEDETVDAMFHKVESIDKIVPVISSDKKYKGIVDREKLLSVLYGKSEGKYGDV